MHGVTPGSRQAAAADHSAASRARPLVPGCRLCGGALTTTMVDLGDLPLANSYLPDIGPAAAAERRYPLHARVCGQCWLVQVDQGVAPEAIFDDYAYFSSMSESWVAHAADYAEAMIRRYALPPDARIIEVASNDGYLLQHFARAGRTVLGIDPAANVAAVAVARGIPTEVAYFGRSTADRLAERGHRADLMVANNVLAHVPDLGDFVAGFRRLLAPGGVATFEVPHLLALIEGLQFDTIYHEHASYLSLLVIDRVMAGAGLRVFDVERLPTHGGSLRLHVCHDAAGHAATPAVDALRREEAAAGLNRLETYTGFARRVEEVVAGFRRFLATARADGRSVAAYGAAAKGNTFLSTCGVGPEDIRVVFDRSPAKQGRFLPGTHIPIVAPDRLGEIRPDYLVILPWNLRDEIQRACATLSDWGGQFVIAVPQTQVL